MSSDRLEYIFDLISGKNTLGPEFKKLQDQSKKFQENIGKVTKKAAVGFVGLSAAIAGAVSKASAFEDINIQFEILTGSVSKASKAMKQLTKFSDLTPYDIREVAEAGKLLVAYGFSVEELTDRLKQIGDVSAAVGKPLFDIVNIFGQVAAAGKLTGERFLQFQEKSIALGPAIAKTMGVAEKSVRDLISRGLVDFDTFQKAFKSLSEEGGVAFNGMERLAGTLSGKISTLTGKFDIFVGNIGNYFLPASKQVVQALIDIFELFGKYPIVTKSAATILAVGAAVTGLTATIGVVLIGLTKFITALKTARLAAIAMGVSLKSALIGTGVGAAIVGLGILVEELATNWEINSARIRAVWNATTKFLKGNLEYVKSLFENTFDKIFSYLSNITDSIADGVGNTFNKIKSFFSGSNNEIDKTKNKVQELRNKLSEDIESKPIPFEIDWTEVDEIKKRLEKELANATEKGSSEGLGNSGKKISDTFKDRIKKAWKEVKFSGSPKEIVKSLETAWKKVDYKKSLKGLGDSVEDAADKLKTAWDELDWDKVTVGFVGALSKGREGAKMVLKESFVWAAEKMLGPIGQAAGPIMDLLMMNSEQLRQTIREFAKAIPEFIRAIIENIPVLITSLIDAIPLLIESLTTLLFEKLTNPVFLNEIMIQIAVAFVKAVPLMVTGFVRGMRDGLTQGIIDAFKQAFDKLRDLFKKIFKFDGGGTGAVEDFLHFDFPFMKFARGGIIGGNSRVPGDSNLNDTVPALLSPGEVVLPKSIVKSGSVGSIVDFMKGIGAPVQGFGFGGFIESLVGGAVSVFESLYNSVTGQLGKLPLVGSAFESFNERIIEPMIRFVQLGRIPKELIEVVKSLYQIGANVKLSEILTNPIEGVKNAVRSVADGFSPAFRKLLTPVGMANGGVLRVPGVAGGDIVPSMLSPGEMVVDRSTTSKLQDFLNGGDSSTQVLLKILSVLQQPQQVSTSVVINNEVFANMILELNRRNSRLTV